MKSRGLGDSIEKFTKATGIKTIVDRVSEGLNIPCGCEGRRDALNMLFPYKKKGKKVSWSYGGKRYSGTLIPSRETKTHRFARTANGKIKKIRKRKK